MKPVPVERGDLLHIVVTVISKIDSGSAAAQVVAYTKNIPSLHAEHFRHELFWFITTI